MLFIPDTYACRFIIGGHMIILIKPLRKKTGSGTVYYRPRMADQQGTVHYSQVVALHGQFDAGISLRPLTPVVNGQMPMVQIRTDRITHAHLTVVDMNGREPGTCQLALPAGETITGMPLSNLVTGVYMLRLTDQSGRLLAAGKLLMQ